jgi:DinB superfamily
MHAPNESPQTDRFETGEPSTKVEIAEALYRLLAASEDYLATLSNDAFFQRQGDKWSPSEHVRHLSKSCFAVARGLKLPRILLRLRFGRPHHPARSFVEMREVYRALLAAGAKAGRFAPTPQPLPSDPESRRREIMAAWRASCTDLVAGLQRWPEEVLDRLAMPHPLLGKLSVREMLFFSVYHNAHHLRRVEERAAAAS